MKSQWWDWTCDDCGSTERVTGASPRVPDGWMSLMVCEVPVKLRKLAGDTLDYCSDCRSTIERSLKLKKALAAREEREKKALAAFEASRG